ncbi:hypothetical protein [Leeuwenhoekiella parthenopeia]|uniref:DUF4180 domain-containing protein n=1 Tax=Leeuwenhoekiella parthenopeia TaxID=2890320 RepID=A0ABS8GPQ6_9FLAO|nr:hypothetical protein [Leeuwenhoekiella parthenopeia]MCC4211950.1 hypothetical protein [Leeuwenhoekiella parthenopeia]
MLLKTITYSFGEAKYYAKFIHFKFNEDLKEVVLENSKQIFADVESFYGSDKYVFISERGLGTSLDPSFIKSLNLSKMKAVAVVSPDVAKRRDELIKEQNYIKGSFAFFTSYEAAEHWARTFD